MVPSIEHPKWRELVVEGSAVRFTGLATRIFFARLRLMSGRDGEASLQEAVEEAHDFFVRNEGPARADLELAFGKDPVT